MVEIYSYIQPSEENGSLCLRAESPFPLSSSRGLVSKALRYSQGDHGAEILNHIPETLHSPLSLSGLDSISCGLWYKAPFMLHEFFYLKEKMS